LVSTVTEVGTIRSRLGGELEARESGAVESSAQAKSSPRMASMGKFRETASLRASLNVYVIAAGLSDYPNRGTQPFPHHRPHTWAAIIYGISQANSTYRFLSFIQISMSVYSHILLCCRHIET
jgi:hypothetical protein